MASCQVTASRQEQLKGKGKGKENIVRAPPQAPETEVPQVEEIAVRHLKGSEASSGASQRKSLSPLHRRRGLARRDASRWRQTEGDDGSAASEKRAKRIAMLKQRLLARVWKQHPHDAASTDERPGSTENGLSLPVAPSSSRHKCVKTQGGDRAPTHGQTTDLHQALHQRNFAKVHRLLLAQAANPCILAPAGVPYESYTPLHMLAQAGKRTTKERDSASSS